MQSLPFFLIVLLCNHCEAPHETDSQSWADTYIETEEHTEIEPEPLPEIEPPILSRMVGYPVNYTAPIVIDLGAGTWDDNAYFIGAEVHTYDSVPEDYIDMIASAGYRWTNIDSAQPCGVLPQEGSQWLDTASPVLVLLPDIDTVTASMGRCNDNNRWMFAIREDDRFLYGDEGNPDELEAIGAQWRARCNFDAVRVNGQEVEVTTAPERVMMTTGPITHGRLISTGEWVELETGN